MYYFLYLCFLYLFCLYKFAFTIRGIAPCMTQARIKQLKRGAPTEYPNVLPASPAQLLREYPALCLSVFSRESPPVSCPLNKTAMSFVRSKISCRGNKESNNLAGASGAPAVLLQGAVGVTGKPYLSYSARGDHR